MQSPGREDTWFFTGYAKLPSGITASELNKIIGIGLEVEASTGRIVEADCTLATSVGRDFFRRLVIGMSLDTELPTVISRIEKRYHGSAQKSLVSALRLAQDRYRAQKSKASEGSGR
jgi:calcineurin-like phosphoesterase